MVSDEGFQEKFPDMFKLIFQKKFQYKPLPKLRINLKINPLQILKGIKLNNFEMEALIIDLGNLDDIELPNYCEKKMLSMENNNSVPMLFPFEPSEFWSQMRQIVKEEVRLTQKGDKGANLLIDTSGLTQKPLYKINELCLLFNISRTTIYDWVKHGKLKRVKIRSRVYFLGPDVQQLLK